MCNEWALFMMHIVSENLCKRLNVSGHDRKIMNICWNIENVIHGCSSKNSFKFKKMRVEWNFDVHDLMHAILTEIISKLLFTGVNAFEKIGEWSALCSEWETHSMYLAFIGFNKQLQKHCFKLDKNVIGFCMLKC